MLQLLPGLNFCDFFHFKLPKKEDDNPQASSSRFSRWFKREDGEAQSFDLVQPEPMPNYLLGMSLVPAVCIYVYSLQHCVVVFENMIFFVCVSVSWLAIWRVRLLNFLVINGDSCY